jgi:hypothetical protein
MIPAKDKSIKRLTDQERVLLMLNQAGLDGVTTAQLLTISHRFSARIWDLRKKGWNIVTKDVPGEEWARFVLVPEVINVPQLELLPVPLVPGARPWP